MRNKFNFIRANKEFEPIYDAPALNKVLAEEYKMKEV
jgi:hypothetical protein